MNGKIGKYRLLEMVGAGPIGAVYKAFDEELSQNVALRIFGDEIKWDSALKERFHEQCQSVAELHHPNIIRIHEHGEADDVVYITMEMPEGKNLRNMIDARPDMSVEEKLSMMSQTAEGLHFAHQMGSLHRNLRPENIYLSPDGTIQVMDFVIGHLLSSHVTPPGIQWGSQIYISPEQIEGKETGARSDVFSLGLIFYELFTYLHPFHDKNSSQALDNILFQTQFPTVEQFPELPLGLWPILEKCLAKQRDDRYESMKELLEACGQLRRDLKEDCQAMLVELHTVLPRLKEAAQRPGAPPVLTQLLGDIQSLLASDAMTDYLPLNRLLAVLAEHYRAIHAMFDSPESAGHSQTSLPPEPAAEAKQDSEQAGGEHRQAQESIVDESTPTADTPEIPSPSPREEWGRQAESLATRAETGEGQERAEQDNLAAADCPSNPLQQSAGKDATQEEVADLLRSIEFAQEKIRETVEHSLVNNEGSHPELETAEPPLEEPSEAPRGERQFPGAQESAEVPEIYTSEPTEAGSPPMEEE